MKNKTLILVLGAYALLGVAAVPVAPSEKLVRIQAEIPSGDVQAFFENSVTVDDKTFTQPWESVSWNSGDETVTVNGETKTYSQVMQFVVAIANKERSKRINPQPGNP
jgi:hypothetical protein